MIKLDSGAEEFVFENDWDTAVPITVRKKDGGEMCIEVFPSYEAEAREFENKFFDDPFSSEALAFIWDRIGSPMRARGYEDEKKFRHRWCYNYVLRPSDAVRAGAVLPGTERLTKKLIRGKKNLTTFDLDRYIEEEMAAFVHIEGGDVVSIAAENISCSGDFDDDPECGGTVEIGVETAVDHRRRGYAASCVAALSRSLFAEGLYVTYEAYCDNTASQKTAVSAGFNRYGKCYYYVMRK